MKFRSSLAACAAGVLAFASAPNAFDGNIQGFILGAGIGPTFINSHEIEAKADDESESMDLETEGMPIQFNWLIGGAWDPQNALFFNNHISYYTIEDDDNTSFMSRGMLGYRHYFVPAGPGGYIEASVGVAVFQNPDLEEDFSGPSFGVAGGYMFSPHYSVEVGLDISEAEHSEDVYGTDVSLAFKMTSLYISINALAF